MDVRAIHWTGLITAQLERLFPLPGMSYKERYEELDQTPIRWQSHASFLPLSKHDQNQTGSPNDTHAVDPCRLFISRSSTSLHRAFKKHLSFAILGSVISDYHMRLPLLLSFVLAAPAFAQLKWDSLEQNVKVKPGDREAVATYRFTNTGSSTVTIENVRTSCGCTTAALAKKDYAPGESGQIVAHMEVANRTGRQVKSITVTTNTDPKTPTVLQFIADIPVPVVMQPDFVMWALGETPKTKTIDVKVNDGFPAKLLKVDSDNPDIKVEVSEVRPGVEFEVKVTPKDTNRPVNAILLVRTDYPAENPQTYYAYARVK
jgi:hypothetical protein